MYDQTINLSNTQFRYQLVFFIHMYGYIWLAEGCLGKNCHGDLFPGKTCAAVCFAWLHDFPKTTQHFEANKIKIGSQGPELT